MLKSLRIDNFRGVKQLDIRRLQRLNLITGRNGGGKTSLLEAAFLNSGAANAGLVYSIAAFRGDIILQPESDRVFRSCFHDMKQSRHIQIYAEDLRRLKSRARSLVIEAMTKSKPSSRETFLSGVRFRFKGPSGQAVSETSLSFALPEQQMPGALISPIKVTAADNKDLIYAKFISPYVRDVYKEVHDDLVSAVKAKSVGRVVEAVGIAQKGVRDLTPITEWGQPNIYVDIGRTSLFPISVMGAGFFHLLRIGLAISLAEGGIILIDELEDGLHFSIFDKVARIILQALENKNLQIFIATHSGELLKTFVNVAEELKFHDLCLINMSPMPTGVSTRYFDPGELQYALELDAELR